MIKEARTSSPGFSVVASPYKLNSTIPLAVLLCAVHSLKDSGDAFLLNDNLNPKQSIAT